MIRRLITLLVLIPIGIVIIAMAVANRQPVSIALPLEVNGAPIELFTVPLFFLLFAALLVGMMIGGFATWVKQGRHRRVARERKAEATRMGFEAMRQKERADTLEVETSGEKARGYPALPALGSNG